MGPTRAVSWEPRLGRWTHRSRWRWSTRAWCVAATHSVMYGRSFNTRAIQCVGRTRRLRNRIGDCWRNDRAFSQRCRCPPRRARAWLPAPGSGPTPEQRARGFFVVRLFARSERGLELRGEIRDRRGPGYGSTAVMLESALCLARDPLAAPAGVSTPAAALGDALLTRLRAAGMTWQVEPGAE